MTTTEYGRPVLPDPVEVAIAGEEKARLRLQRQRERRERERQAQQVRGGEYGQAVACGPFFLFVPFCDTSCSLRVCGLYGRRRRAWCAWCFPSRKRR